MLLLPAQLLSGSCVREIKISESAPLFSARIKNGKLCIIRMFKYETHCHTSPVSYCGKASPDDTVLFYKHLGYDGVFITNHFLDGNIEPTSRNMPYQEQINFYFSDYESALESGEKYGIKVFPGVEMSYLGTDFLIYGLYKDWYLTHPEIMEMDKRTELAYLRDSGAMVIQAHPYREANYIDHIRLFPRSVDGVEVINSSQVNESNELSFLYAEHYGLFQTAGSDNHWGQNFTEHALARNYSGCIAGVMTKEPINSVEDYIYAVKNGKTEIFSLTEEEILMSCC